jgi:putative CocE/NonD family hydrolase
MGDITVLRDVMVTMRDGIRLATDIYIPTQADQPLPVLLERTPYDKAGVNQRDFSLADRTPMSRPEVAAIFARNGYAVVIQDCRGRYNSEGLFTKYLSEGADGVDTLDWLLQQDWCSGRIGTFGLSYGAHTQMALACLNPAGLSAMFVESGGFSSAFHNGIRQGGAFELKQATWALTQAQHSAKSKDSQARGAALGDADVAEWFSRMPWSRGDSPLRDVPEYEDYLFEQWEHGEFGPYWTAVGLYAKGYYDAMAAIPMVHMTGWFDPYARTAIENFTGLASHRNDKVRLVMGPWTHGQRSVSHSGDVEFGPHAPLDGNIAPDYIQLRLSWFDRYLKDKQEQDYLPKPVKLFVMGGGTGARNAEGRLEHGGQWRDEDTWPPQGTRIVPHYLAGDGALRAGQPGAPATLSYTFDPRDPVPTIGGAVTSGEPLMRAGAYDQRESAAIFGARPPYQALSDRSDNLVFQTAPLAADTEVVGPICATLFVSVDTPDTDLTIKLIDVYPAGKDWPDGFALNLSHGILRLRYRNSFSEPELMQPGTVYKVKIEAFPTANLFARGHRIRLDVSSSNFPHFDVNPNSGEPESKASEKRVARVTIHMGQAHPSHVELPLIDRSKPRVS